MNSQPLAGRRVLVTRALHQAGKLIEGLRDLGAEPVVVPVLEIRPPKSYEAMDEALRTLGSYDWLILTSSNTVRALVKRAASLGLSLDKMTLPAVAAIGDATAATARNAGLRVAFLPEIYLSESLVEGLHERVAGKRILLVRAAVARDVIPDALRAAGVTVDVVDAYRNVMPEAAPKQLRRVLEAGIDAATFTSSSSATHLAEAAALAQIAWPFGAVPAISMGPITSRTLRDLGWPPAAEAVPSNIPRLIDTVVQVLTSVNPNDKDSVV